MQQSVKERRVHRRLDLKLPLEYRPADIPRTSHSRTSTINVSTGGLYFETHSDHLRPGDQITLQLAVPESDSRFPPHGKIATIAQVVRTTVIEDQCPASGSPVPRYGIGARFQQGLKLVF